MQKNSMVITLSLFFLFTISIIAFYAKQEIGNRRVGNSNEGITENVKGVGDLTKLPIVTNIAPTVAYIGKEYRYDVGIMDGDSSNDDLKIEINEGPDWLRVNENTLLGVPSFYSKGEFKVVLKVSDEVNSTYTTFYISVLESDEE